MYPKFLNVVAIVGPTGCGRTTIARALVARRPGFEIREFGALDYINLLAFRRELHALAARRGGGLLVQMGAVAGMGVVFDDIDASRTLRTAQSLATEFARNASATLLVVFVSIATSSVSGLRGLLRRSDSKTIVVTRPDDATLLRMARNFAGELPVATIATVVASLKTHERHDLRAARAALCIRLEVPDATTTHGSGVRDTQWSTNTHTTEQLARLAITTSNEAERARVAAVAPRSIAAFHAANIARLLPNPVDRITFARAQASAARCTVMCPFDDQAREIALWTGALAAPTLVYGRLHRRRHNKTRFAKLSRRLVTSPLIALQRRYNTRIKQLIDT